MSHHSLLRGTVTVALAAGLTAGAAGLAHAESLRVDDPRGDLLGYVMTTDEYDEPPPPPQLRPGVANGDIVRTSFRHTDRRIAVRAKFAELRRVGMRRDVLRVVTNEGVRRNVNILVEMGVWAGEADMTRPNGKEVRCAVRHRIDYDTNVVTVSFPRGCVSNPRWVRAGFGSEWATIDRWFADDAQRDGEVFDNLALTKRLRRA
jgi:hypothetical protein